MPNSGYFLPMPHTVAIFVYPGFELLDISGPAAVFTAANWRLRESGKQPFYKLETLSADGGMIASSSAVAVHSRALSRVRPNRVHTLLIAGAEADSVRAVMRRRAVRNWIPLAIKTAVRYGSVCSGAFVLAGLGLLDGKRTATHWDACASLAQNFPSVQVDADSLYVIDGKVWTSAGVATGIDMALEMVSHDLGEQIAAYAAKRLVLYARRPGYQSQFSPLLRAQVNADVHFAELIAWLQDNLGRPMDVPSLAKRAGLSERSFYRKFVAATGETPARFIEAARLDAARVLLSQGLPLKQIAAEVGLAPAPRFATAFKRRFGVKPKLYREMHTMIDRA